MKQEFFNLEIKTMVKNYMNLQIKQLIGLKKITLIMEL